MKKSISAGLITFLLLMSSDTSALEFPLLEISLGTKHAYIVGSMHVGIRDHQRTNDIQTVLRNTKSVCLESVPNDAASSQMAAKAVYGNPPSVKLQDRIGGELYTAVRENLKWFENGGGDLSKLSPFAAATLITMAMPKLSKTLPKFKPENSLDADIIAIASKMQLTIAAVEESHAIPQSASRISDAEWRTYVSSIIRIVQCSECVRIYEENTIKAYLPSGNYNNAYSYTMKAYAGNESAAAVFDKLYFSFRNPLMAKNIYQSLNESSCDVIAIGAGHLGGEHGVIALIKSMGIKVSPLDSLDKFIAPTSVR